MSPSCTLPSIFFKTLPQYAVSYPSVWPNFKSQRFEKPVSTYEKNNKAFKGKIKRICIYEYTYLHIYAFIQSVKTLKNILDLKTTTPPRRGERPCNLQKSQQLSGAKAWGVGQSMISPQVYSFEGSSCRYRILSEATETARSQDWTFVWMQSSHPWNWACLDSGPSRDQAIIYHCCNSAWASTVTLQ